MVQLGPDRSDWSRLGRIGVGRVQMGWVDSDGIGSGRVGRVGLGRVGSDWVGFGLVGQVGWAGSDRIGPDWGASD